MTEPQSALPPPRPPFQFTLRTLLLLFVVLGLSLAVFLSVVGFTVLGLGGKRGKLEVSEYDSKAVGSKRRIVVYIPPDYPRDRALSCPIPAARCRRRSKQLARAR